MRSAMVLILSMLLIFCLHGLAKEPLRMIDPLFGISYDPTQVQFEKAPERIFQLCPDMSNMKQSWTYGYWKTGDTEYFIVSGFMKVHPDGLGPVGIEADELGTVLALQGKKCMVRAGDWILSGEMESSGSKKPALPQEFKMLLPGFEARHVCVSGQCHSEFRSRSSIDALDGLMSNAFDRYVKAFGGKAAFMSAFSAAHIDLDNLYLVVRRHLEKFMKGN
jgi:hypothetical protein